jgi:hypothetical protein
MAGAVTGVDTDGLKKGLARSRPMLDETEGHGTASCGARAIRDGMGAGGCACARGPGADDDEMEADRCNLDVLCAYRKSDKEDKWKRRND